MITAARIPAIVMATLAALAGTAGAQTYCEPPSLSYSPHNPVRGEVVTFATDGADATWQFGDGSGEEGQVVSHTYANAGDYTVTVTATTDCGPRSTSRTLAVLTLICEEPGFTFWPGEPVRDQSITFQTAVDGATWNFGDGGTASGTVVEHTYAAAGTYHVALSGQTPCGPMTAPPRPIRVYDIVCEMPGFTMSPVRPVRGEEVTFETALSPAWWTFGDGDGGSGSVVSHTYEAPGFYDVTLTAQTQCGVLTAPPRTIRVDDIACEMPAFTVTPESPLTGQAATFSTISTGARWDFGDGATAHGKVVAHAYAAPGLYPVILTANTDCGPQTAPARQVRVDDFACEMPGFTFLPAAPLRGQTITFQTPLPEASWSFGDGATGAGSPVPHAYAAAGTYGVTLTARTPCGLLTAPPRPVRVDDFVCELPGFTYSPPRPIPGETITFSTPLGGAVWAFGDGGTGAGHTVTHAYPTTGIFTVSLTADTPCGRLTGHHPVEVFHLICEQPNFHWVPTIPVAGQPVTFTTGAPNPDWDFGDGTRGVGASVSHRYMQPGRYSVNVTSRGPCGTLVSPTRYIDVAGLGCELPTFTASATRADIGQLVEFNTAMAGPMWTFGDGSTGAGAHVSHSYSASGLYEVRLTADTACGRLTSNPQTVAVGGAQGAYHCRVHLTDGYQRTVANQRVFFGIYDLHGPATELIASKEGRTDADGNASLMLSGDRVKALYCWVEGPSLRDAGPMEETLIDHGGLASGAAVILDAVAIPLPRHRQPIRGRRDGNASAALYQSGTYDKVLLIPEPFDAADNVTGKRRNEPKFWLQFKPAMQALYRLGYDVWLVQPPSTGQNIHEQAAQFAQAVNFAVGYGPGASGGKAILFGYSMGGVVLRIATARWEADAQWRGELSLPAQLPASLVMFGDSPLRGAQVNAVLQGFTWNKKKEHEANLDSCAAQQMLREVCHAPGYCTTANWWTFFQSATPAWVSFPARQGTCDTVWENSLCLCEEGPGVFTINGDGWPHTVRKVAFSNGTWDPDYNVCYADYRDDNADGNSICPSVQSLYRPQVGHLMSRMDVGPACPISQEFPAAAGDLEAGSRHDTLYDIRLPANAPMFFNIFCDTIEFTQFFGGTFIPIRSALAADGPGGGPFNEVKHNTFQGTHGNFYPGIFAWAIGEFERAAAGGGSGGLGPAASTVVEASPGDPLRVRLDGTTSQGNGSTFEWRLGDGTIQTGPVVEHQFAVPGIYEARLTVTDASGQKDTSVVRLRAGLPPNAMPVADTGAPYRAVTGAPVSFDASRSTDDNLIVGYEWDFGDGTQGSGVSPDHTYTTAGAYAVKLTVRDSDGETATAETVLRVRVNTAPHVSIETSGRCTASCQLTFTALATDDEDDAISFDWSGCGAGSSTRLTCAVAQSGDVVASVVASDEHGASASAQASLRVYAAAYSIGPWGPCTGTGSYTCTAGGATGCQRPGNSIRPVSETAWTLDPSRAVKVPRPPQQACTEYAPGYVATYTSTYAATWTCTATGPQGCSKARTSYAPSTWRPQAPDAPVPPAFLYTTGYVTAWSAGAWGACSAACGGGVMHRSVTPSAFGPVGPDAPRPDDSMACNTQPCTLTCADMGWYWADQAALCQAECGQPCVKKQWCGSAPCEPWPHYCWKCN